MIRTLFALGLIMAGVLVISDTGPVSAAPGDNSITIYQDTDPEDRTPRFRYEVDEAGGATNLRDFSLRDDDRKEMTGLANGSYRISQREDDGWELASIECRDRRDRRADADVDVREGSRSVRIRFSGEGGEHVRCIFTNELAATPTPVATATPAPVATPVIITVEKPVIVERPVFITPPPAPAAPTVAPAATSIRPPSTGSAGLLTD